MMSRGVVCLCASVLLIGVTGRGWTQTTTGLPQFGSFSGSVDKVNNANLNVHLTIPIFDRAGRGLSLPSKLDYESSVWFPVATGSSSAWQPAAQWGWGNIPDDHIGYVNFSLRTVPCIDPPATGTDQIWSGFQYYDSSGTPHPFSIVVDYETGPACAQGQNTATGLATDGSGYTLTATASSGHVDTVVTDVSGNVIHAANRTSTASRDMTDRNGNQITVTNLGGFTYDTLNPTIPVLTATGSGTPSSPRIFAYTNPSGTTSQYAVNYTNYSVRTSFGCSGITEYNSASQALVSSITLPDLTSYLFTYEPTP